MLGVRGLVLGGLIVLAIFLHARTELSKAHEEIAVLREQLESCRAQQVGGMPAGQFLRRQSADITRTAWRELTRDDPGPGSASKPNSTAAPQQLGIRRPVESRLHTSRRLLACADAPDANQKIVDLSAGVLVSCASARDEGYCAHGKAEEICRATCGLCGSTVTPVQRLRIALNSAIFGLALNYHSLQGFRPTDIYIRSLDMPFGGRPTWQGLDTGYWFYFCNNVSTWVMATTRSASWANCMGLMYVDEMSAHAVLSANHTEVDLDFITKGFEGCDQALQPLGTSSVSTFSSSSISNAPDHAIKMGSNGTIDSCAAAQAGGHCGVREIAAACLQSCGTPVACWLSRFAAQEAVFAPQQAVRLTQAGTQHYLIAWQASPQELTDAQRQASVVTEVHLDECSLSSRCTSVGSPCAGSGH